MTPESLSRGLRFLAAGDVYLERLDRKEPFLKVMPLLEQADIKFCNLEAPFTRGSVPLPGRRVSLRTDPRLFSVFSASGFNIVSLANNHMMDFGEKALRDTLGLLKKARIQIAGAGTEWSEIRKPGVINRKGLRIGLLAYCSILGPGTASASHQPCGVVPLRILTFYHPDFQRTAEHPGTPPKVFTQAVKDDLDGMRNDIKTVRSKVDVLLVSAHWGLVGKHEVLDYQREVGREAVNCGADLVLGHHGHVVQGIEVFKGKLICYGLGNFIFGHSNPNFGDIGLVVASKISKGGFENIRLIPIAFNSYGEPVPLAAHARDQAYELIIGLSKTLGTNLVVTDDGLAPLSQAT